MASSKASADHVESLSHEAVLTGVVALATLFSHCVEAFGLIHPTHKWDKDEQLLLASLGLQQARLLIWGDVLGISSPPASVTNSAVPRYPSSAYPDLTEPTFFGGRDARLDEPATRTEIEGTLSAILDRPKSYSREQMMSIYGLKPPKRFTSTSTPALDVTRLEGFREKWELLQEVAESYARINTRRTNSILYTSWQIAECPKFAEFIKLTQEKVDHLVELMGVKEQVDRGIRMDIRGFGWHVIPDRSRVAHDTSKLRLLQEVCKKSYPEYVVATEQALEQISREARESASIYNPNAAASKPSPAKSNGGSDHQQKDRRRSSGIFGLFKSRKSHDGSKGHARNDSGLAPPESGPERSASDSGPSTALDDEAPLGRIRSKSVGAWIDPAVDETDGDLSHHFESLHSHAETGRKLPSTVGTAQPDVIRHDQYKGIARTETRDLHQADY